MAIYIVRHGESIGNIDLKNYRKIADHAFALTDLGVKQAKDAAKVISNHIQLNSTPNKVDSIVLWNSPFERARRTSDVIFEEFNNPESRNYQYVWERVESPLIIEKQYGLYNAIAGEGFEDGRHFAENFPRYDEEYRRCDEFNGRFFARPPGGESDFDVFQRCEIFWEKLFRYDEDLSRHHVIVCHGTTMRLLTMGYLNKPYEWFQSFKLPENGAVILPERGILQEDGTGKPMVVEE